MSIFQLGLDCQGVILVKWNSEKLKHLTVVSIVVSFKHAQSQRYSRNNAAQSKECRFCDLCKICDHYFGEARQTGGSHRIYKTPWQGDPRVNIQNDKGMAKVYQVKQVLKAIERLEAQENVEE